MLCLELRAPFATFRTFTAGSFRSTAGFITPSAAYGLLLNVVGIEMRFDDGKSAMSLIKNDLPKFRIALGIPVGKNGKPVLPQQQSIYQQLHNYPVGADARKKYKPLAMGNKYNITPARRAFLSDLHAYLAVDGESSLETAILEGLEGNNPRQYGLLFLGDNNFLPDVLQKIELPSAFWWEYFTEGELRDNVTRLTISIDRADMSKTKSALFAPSDFPTDELPTTSRAWVEVGY